MSEQSESATAGAPVDVDDSEALAVRLGATRFELTVESVRSLSTTMVRVQLTGEALRHLTVDPGQDLMLTAVADRPVVRRRWTVRQHDAERGMVALDVVLHPGADGASRLHEAAPGTVVEAIGPRGKVRLASGARAHHFLGDQSFLPAAYAMAEAVAPPATAHVTLTVPSPDDRLPQRGDACPDGTTWVEEASDDAATGRALLEASGLGAPVDGAVVYVGGEMTMAATIRTALVRQLGWPREAVLPKPYWRRGTPNARHGEPGRE